jgi:sugar lactone lactonase YvrE
MSARLDRPRRLGVVSVATLALAALSVAMPAALTGSAQAADSHGGATYAHPPATMTSGNPAPLRSAQDTLGPAGHGVLYVADYAGSRIVAIAPDGAESTFSSGFSQPMGVTAAPDGTVYVADYGTNRVVEVAPDGTQSDVPVDGLNGPIGLGLDPDGNLFIADNMSNRVVEIAADGTQTTLPFDNLVYPNGLAVDSAGDVFVAGFGNGQVYKMTPDGTQSTIGSGFSNPSGVDVDSDGNVFVADPYLSQVSEVAPDGTQTASTFAGSSFPIGIGADQAGNVFDTDNSSVFQRTTDGTTSAVVGDVFGYDVSSGPTPQVVTFTTEAPTDAVPGDTYTVAATGGETGNPVTFTADAASARICVVTDNGDDTASVDLNRVGDCVIDADQAGSTDVAPGHAAQSVTIRHRQWISFTSTPERPRVGDTYTVTASGGGSGNPVAFALAAGSLDGCTVTSDGLVTFLHATSCTIGADQAGNGDYVAAATAYQTIAVNRGLQKVVFTSTRTQGRVGATYRPTALGGATQHRIRFSASGACSARSGVITFTHAGHCYVFANQTGDADYRPGKAHQTIVVVKP